jgi:hypothetical protein
MQDELLMRHWMANHDRFSTDFHAALELLGSRISRTHSQCLWPGAAGNLGRCDNAGPLDDGPGPRHACNHASGAVPCRTCRGA